MRAKTCAALVWLLFGSSTVSLPQPVAFPLSSKRIVRREDNPVEDPASYEIEESTSDFEHDAFADFEYSPAADFPSKTISKWIALGDSFAAGPGTGEAYDDDSTCKRGADAYPIRLQNHRNMKGPQGRGEPKPAFDFAACTGATTVDLLDTTLDGNQLVKIDTDTSMVTLSITGNDVGFSDVLKACVYNLFRAGDCENRLKEARGTIYSSKLWKQYNDVVTETINRFDQTKIGRNTLVYQQGYLQFFDETTDQCDQARFRLGGPYITKDLRKAMNVLTHQLNYVVQYWMDLRNVQWSSRNPHLTTAFDWVDVDWRYNNHRFCRPGVEEPKQDPDTWFFHLPKPIRWDMDQDEAFDFLEKSWDPEVNTSTAPTWVTKTFHPKPQGFAKSVGMHLYKLYFLEQLSQMPKKRFSIMCVGDYTTLGKSIDPGSPERYTYIPHLRRLLKHHALFNYGEPGGRNVVHRFIGSVDGAYEGDQDHEIRPNYDSIKAIAYAISTKSLCNWYPIGKVIPVMIGHDELLGGREPEDVVRSIRKYLLPVLWKFDKDATILLAQIPLYGIPDYGHPDKEGSKFKIMQERFIEFNARIAGLVIEEGEKGKKILKVHTSAPLTEHMQDDRQYLGNEGNDRIAWDFLENIARAQRNGWFDGDKWDNTDTFEEEPDLPSPSDDKYECIQPKADNAPSTEELLSSLFRGMDPNNRDLWIEEKACKPDSICAFSWDNKTCVYAGGDGDRSTHHQVIVKHYGDELDTQDCKDNVKKVLDCLDNNFYGGISKGSSGYYSLTNLKWTEENKEWPLDFVDNWEQLSAEDYDKINDEAPTPRDPWDPKPLPESSTTGTRCKAYADYNIEEEIPERPPPMDDGFWDGDEPSQPSSTPQPGLDYEDHCADTSVVTSFDYGTANADINDFCKGGLDLLVPSAPLWYTYAHTDTHMKLHLGIQWTQRENGQDGCNPYQNSDHMDENVCVEQFLAAMNRCNKDTVDKKYGQSPMTWNSPGGCVDFWLVGHGEDWDCDNLDDKPEECEGKKKGT